MSWIELLRWLHMIGATVLLGTGAGIAFFMLMAHRSKDIAMIAHTARIVVIADYIFTASAVIAQPVTGYLLARALGLAVNRRLAFTVAHSLRAHRRIMAAGCLHAKTHGRVGARSREE